MQHSTVQYSGGVHGETDRGELRELGQVVEDGVESHRTQKVAARVLLSVITSSINHLANLAKIQQGDFVLYETHCTVAQWNIAVKSKFSNYKTHQNIKTSKHQNIKTLKHLAVMQRGDLFRHQDATSAI